MIKLLIYAGLGSFIGGGLRFILNKAIPWEMTDSFPWATFIVNITGCFLIGLIYGIVARMSNINEALIVFLSVGICGGLTTFSTFMNENLLLLSAGRFFTACLYAAVSFITGLLCIWLGRKMILLF